MDGRIYCFTIKAVILTRSGAYCVKTQTMQLPVNSSPKQTTNNCRDVSINDIDTTKLLLCSNIFLLSGRLISYPAYLIKTRIQYSSLMATTKSSARVLFSSIIKSEGLRGLYRGFPAFAIGVIPSQTVYYGSYELVREQTADWVERVRDARRNRESIGRFIYDWMTGKLSAQSHQPKVLSTIEPSILNNSTTSQAAIPSIPVESKQHLGFTELAVVNLVAGTTSSIISQVFIVPVEVVAQQTIVSGGLLRELKPRVSTTIREIAAANGPAGFYRGFLASSVSYATSSAIWWIVYATAKHYLRQQQTELNSDSAVIIASGFTASVSSIVVRFIHI
jgi:hypothetical protein